ncbi:ATP-binding cassette domain-containing protein [Georgenia deserti]|uniref:ATP-binding cassette domain-containing protein n=1 Tax=Georgenia deserti TaxID=2093781 RepID=A0ABW4L650_9MICO
MIDTRDLRRDFHSENGTVHAVRGIDLSVSPGEVVALLGPNGAGKSTTLRMLTTLLPPTSGSAVVAGHDVGTEPVEVRRRIGYIGQGNGSFNGLRVQEELYTQARLYGLDRHTARRRTAELLEQLQLADLSRRDVARLSGGQRRRLDIAMGIVHSPSLVFLDEPSAGLDPQSRSNLWDHMDRMRREQDTTIVLTTHYLDEADLVAERVVVIDHGTIIADGTPDELKSQVSGDLVALELMGVDDAASAADVARAVPDAGEVSVDGTVVQLRVHHGDSTTPELVRALDAAGVRLVATQVRRPSLDDVFLSLTGRSLREGEAA